MMPPEGPPDSKPADSKPAEKGKPPAKGAAKGK
jgi:hypothetical protein